jgi:mono/diheme cytochrome c family protein
MIVGLCMACSPAGRSAEAPPQPPPASARDSSAAAALVDSGREAYRRHYCGLCHRLEAANTSGAFAPTHDAMGATADDRIRYPGYTGNATTAEGYIRESILDPDTYVVPGYGGSRFRMPAYTHLDESDLEALVQLLLEER